MSQQFRTVTTNAGRNAVREALTQGKTVKLSHMSVGDGGGNPVTPLSTMTKLVNERFRAQINDIVLDPATPDLFTAELFIPQAEGGWYIREVGLAPLPARALRTSWIGFPPLRSFTPKGALEESTLPDGERCAEDSEKPRRKVGLFYVF